MPKDATKNIDRYKVRGGELNEFDFHQNQEEFAEQRKGQVSLIPGTPPEAKRAVKVATTRKGASAKKRVTNKTTKKTAKKATKKK